MKPAQASSTAKLIAASTILLGSDPRTSSLVAPGAVALCERLLSGSRTDRWLAKSASWAPTRWVWRRLERLVLPGIVSHYWHRKRWIERRCRAAIAEGFERVVVIGAGFDTLALRLAGEFPEVDWIEIDHPATQKAKRLALFGDPAAAQGNLHFIELNLTTCRLPPERFADGKASVFIAEGVLMYLSPADVDTLFDAIRQLPARSARIVFSFMSTWVDGSSGFRPRSWLVERWLAWHSEPFSWSMDPKKVRRFLTGLRMKPIEMARTRELAAEAGDSHSTVDGENLIVCQTNEWHTHALN